MSALPPLLHAFIDRLQIAAQAGAALSAQPQDLATIAILAKALRNVGCLDEAILTLNYGAALAPKHREFQELMVLCLINNHRFSDAVAVAAAVLTSPLPSQAPLAPPALSASPPPPPPRAASAEMQSLTRLYQQMHAHQTQDGAQYEGFVGLVAHAWPLRRLAQKFQLKSLLDYGGGKGRGWSAGPIHPPGAPIFPTFRDFVGVETVEVYDPGVTPYALPPRPQGWDGVVCLDVLEHIPEQDVDWVLEEIFAAARRVVMLNIALYPASYCFADGRNVHITLKTPEWWAERLEQAWARRPQLRVACYFSGQTCSIASSWIR